VNTGAPRLGLDEAERRVLAMQTKLHRWATSDAGRRFDDVYNLVYDPAFLVVAWNRVRGNKGARSAGVDGIAPRSITDIDGFLDGLRDDLKARRFSPTRVREKMIPKAGGKLRRLGIPTVADRVAQAVLKLVLEPIFEADFKPCSYLEFRDFSGDGGAVMAGVGGAASGGLSGEQAKRAATRIRWA
jgi:RNA-directed DNA polymerase